MPRKTQFHKGDRASEIYFWLNPIISGTIERLTKSEFIPKCIREAKGQLYQQRSENKMVGVNLLYGREGFPHYVENLRRKKRIHLFPLNF